MTTSNDAVGTKAVPTPLAPWRETGFWLLELVVLTLALIRLAVTVAYHLDAVSIGVEFSTLAIFLVPMVVASLNYGLVGGVVTTAWITVLSIPRYLAASGPGDTSALWAESLQLALLFGIALLVGQRVTSQARSRRAADASLAARLQAEALYQDVFESNRAPILIVDADGVVIQANPAADTAFTPGGAGGAPGRRLVDVVGADASALVLGKLISDESSPGGPFPTEGEQRDPDADARIPPVAFTVDGGSVLYRPSATLVGPRGSDRRMQVIFEDVTAETRRHDLLEAFANQVVLGQEEERRHLAQELHDGPVQALIHLCRQIDVLSGDPGHPASDAAALAALRADVEATVGELRSIARGLRPSVLDDLGLVASLNQLVVEAVGRQGFSGDFHVTGSERRLPVDSELAVFRIAQEAVTNIERHASASSLQVTLQFEDDALRLQVTDDGSGFHRRGGPTAIDGQSLGLPGMHERARLAGGRLVVRTSPGHGTTVEARIPVPTAPAHQTDRSHQGT